MAIIMRGDVPRQRQMGIGTAIKQKLAEKALVDLPVAAVKTAAGIPIFGGQEEESEQDKMLREAIEKLIAEGTGDVLTPRSALLPQATQPLGAGPVAFAPSGMGSGVNVGLLQNSGGMGSAVPVTLMPQGMKL